MKINDYGLNAYKKNSSKETSNKMEKDLTVKKAVKNLNSEKSVKTVNKLLKDVSDESLAKPVVKTKSSFISDPSVKAAIDPLTRGGLIKISRDEKKAEIYRRVAKFLIIIGVDNASEVLKHLPQEDTEKIVSEIIAVRQIEPDEALSILEEFNSVIETVKVRGGTKTAKSILEKAFGSQKAQDLLDRLNIQKQEVPFEYLSEKEPEKIFDLLKEETNSIRALVLSYVQPQKAASVINMLSKNDKKEVILHLAKTKQVLPEVISRVDKVIHEKSLKQIDVRTNKIDGKNILAQILKKMDMKSENEIIQSLEDIDPLLSEDLKSRLFTIEDVINADDRFIQQYLRELNDIEIAYLVANKSLEFRAKIFDNMSKVRSEVILEEEEYRKPMLKKDCDEITQKFISHLRRAYESGQLMINGRDEEKYV